MINASEMIQNYGWRSAWHEAQYACYGDADNDPADFALAQVAEVLAAAEGDNDGPDWICVCRMKDGQFTVMRAGCDYTGWDCRASGRLEYFSTLADATSPLALTADERVRLDLPETAK